ncbi:MAG: sugar kinase [Clostridiales bacterium]|nr:sugar kinase [Clostridiales bacterium]
MNRIITLGEIMLRLSPPGYERILQTESFDVKFGGGEANVAVSLANYGESAAFVSAVPDNLLGQAAINSLRRYGVDTSLILRSGKRLGIYYLEKGASQRPSKVVYDRAASSISEVSADQFDWDNIFSGADWLHFTGITPALSDSAAALCLEAVKQAKAKGLQVSCDLNYRKNLWSKEKAGQVMETLMPYVDLCIANEEDAADVFGIKAKHTDIQQGSLDKEGYIEVAKELIRRFGLKRVAITLRESLSASTNNWSALLTDGKEFNFAKKYTIQIVDRVGGGDSFGAGLIYGLLNLDSDREALEFATAASCLKHTIEGDYNLVSVSEVTALMKGDGSGRVQR